MKRDRGLKIFRNIPEIKTERLLLRRFSVSDHNDMYEYASNDEVTRYLLWEPHENVRYTIRYIKYVIAKYRTGEFYDWAITLRESGKMIGTCGFTSFDFSNKSGEVGYVINPAYRGRGIAPEALRAVIRFGFEVLGLERIEAKYMVGNESSRRVMEKCGMSFEGIKRSGVFSKGMMRDIGVCAVLYGDLYES